MYKGFTFSGLFVIAVIRLVNAFGSDRYRENLRKRLSKSACKPELSDQDRAHLELVVELID